MGAAAGAHRASGRVAREAVTTSLHLIRAAVPRPAAATHRSSPRPSPGGPVPESSDQSEESESPESHEKQESQERPHTHAQESVAPEASPPQSLPGRALSPAACVGVVVLAALLLWLLQNRARFANWGPPQGPVTPCCHVLPAPFDDLCRAEMWRNTGHPNVFTAVVAPGAGISTCALALDVDVSQDVDFDSDSSAPALTAQHLQRHPYALVILRGVHLNPSVLIRFQHCFDDVNGCVRYNDDCVPCASATIVVELQVNSSEVAALSALQASACAPLDSTACALTLKEKFVASILRPVMHVGALSRRMRHVFPVFAPRPQEPAKTAAG